MANLFRPDRPATDTMLWYLERKERCIEQIWNIACAILDTETDVILELGLIQQHSRKAFYKRIDCTAYELTIHVLDVPRSIRRDRVRSRNLERGTTYSMEVPDHIFELASDLWEEPDELESCDRDMRFITLSDEQLAEK